MLRGISLEYFFFVKVPYLSLPAPCEPLCVLPAFQKPHRFIFLMVVWVQGCCLRVITNQECGFFLVIFLFRANERSRCILDV